MGSKTGSNCLNNVLDFVDLAITTSGKRDDQSFTTSKMFTSLILDKVVHVLLFPGCIWHFCLFKQS